MKTKRIPLGSSSVDMQIPTSWSALPPALFRYVCGLMCTESFSQNDIKTYLIYRLSRLPWAVFRSVPPLAVADLFDELDWMDYPPEVPVRLPQMDGHPAVDAELHGVRFDDYLKIENLYQGFLMSANPEAVNMLAALLYPGYHGTLSEIDRQCVIMWIVGLKSLFLRVFPDLFQNVEGKLDTDSEAPDMRRIMVAEIRLLTGGDITKEKYVLAADTWSALQELNEKSRESREMQKKMK